jgi:hypothetical protein
MESITRISDLPEQSNIYSPSLPTPPTQQMNPVNTGTPSGYMPINVHPNPYGVSTQNPIMPPPQQPDVQNPQMPYFSEEQLMQMQRQRLPSRDIPRDTLSHTHDDEIKPNYIPRVRFEEDYVRKHEDMTDHNLKEYEAKNRRERKLDILLNELQTPIFIAILFFFFQLPLVNMFFKRFSFLSIYNSDGHFNIKGLLLKSIIFGSIYYTTMKMTSILSEF